ncbi:MAG: hypothetical protein KVP17_000928 [Porospora cf. gigantea B]|nr:MAG: hypothetical protein KVP17_000928 [Porospora cf. gigantea B]
MLVWFEILETFRFPGRHLRFCVGIILFSYLALLCCFEVKDILFDIFVYGWIHLGLVLTLRLGVKLAMSRIPDAVQRYAEFDGVVGTVHMAAAVVWCCLLLICVAMVS